MEYTPNQETTLSTRLTNQNKLISQTPPLRTLSLNHGQITASDSHSQILSIKHTITTQAGQPVNKIDLYKTPGGVQTVALQIIALKHVSDT